MKLAINVIIFLLIIGLVYVLVTNIREPIKFKTELERREQAVVDKLIEVRKAQLAYREITGEFAGQFDSLKYTLNNDSFRLIKAIGDPDDPEDPTITYDTTYYSARDSMQALGVRIDSIQYVPYSGGETFNMSADTLTYQNTLVHVVEVSVPYRKFMGPWADPRFSQYDNSYDPNSVLKFGNMNAPNTAGNWER